MGIHFRLTYFPIVRKTGIFHAALGKHQFDTGVLLTENLYGIKMIPCIPVHGRTCDVAVRSRYGDRVTEPLIEQFLIVIPDIDVHILHTGSLQCRPQMLCHKQSFFLRTVGTGIPGLYRCRFVLYRHRRDRHSRFPVLPDKFHKVLCPQFSDLFLPLPSMVHLSVGLHIGRWGPGRCQKMHLPTRTLHGSLYHGNDLLSVVRDGKTVQRRIVLFHISIIAQREITAVNGYSAQMITQPLVSEISFYQFLFLFFAETMVIHSTALRECPSESLHRLFPDLWKQLHQIHTVGTLCGLNRCLLPIPLFFVICLDPFYLFHDLLASIQTSIPVILPSLTLRASASSSRSPFMRQVFPSLSVSCIL